MFVPGLFWCNFLYLVTIARFVADQFLCEINNNVCDFMLFWCFVFVCLFPDIGEPGMGSDPLSFLGS